MSRYRTKQSEQVENSPPLGTLNSIWWSNACMIKKTIQIELLFFLRKCASCFQLRQVLGHVTVYFVIKHFYKILCVKFCTRVLKSWKSIASRVAYKQYVFVFKRSILIYDVASFLGLSTFLSNLFCSFTSCRVSNLNATLQQL